MVENEEVYCDSEEGEEKQVVRRIESNGIGELG
jgi:hypothetical protein